MKGKPPKIIENLEWFRKNFQRYFLHIFLIASAYWNWQLYSELRDLKFATYIQISTLEERLIDYRGCRTQSPMGDPPLFVTFSDGKSAYINSFHMMVPAEDSDFESIKWQETYIQRSMLILNALKAAIFSELEVVGFEYAKENRKELAASVLERLNLVLTEMEIDIYKFYFHEFCLVEQ